MEENTKILLSRATTPNKDLEFNHSALLTINNKISK
jgi:hypothetical protein